MKKKFSIAISLAVILTLVLTSLALAADPTAHVEFTTDAPCPVIVSMIIYSDPAGNSRQIPGVLTPRTIDTSPSTPVTFFYPASVVCSGITYSLESITPYVPPGEILRSGAADTTTTVTGHYALPDSTAPTLHLPGNMTVEATAPTGATVNFSVTADDTNPAHPAVTCNPSAGSTFPLGTTTVYCSATDAANNTANSNFNVTVVDTAGPTITDNADMTIEGNTAGGANVTYADPRATDIVDANPGVSCLPASGSFFALGGPTVVTCTATDASSNSTSSSFDVTVVDTIAPTLVGMPADMTVEGNATGGANVTYTAPTATDIVDTSPSVSCTPASGSFFALGGPHTVICTATDDSLNSSNALFNVTVQADTTPPTIAPHGDETAEATSALGATVNYIVPATSDEIDGAGTAICAPASGAQFALGNTTVYCDASDTAGNHAAQTSFVVHVVDTTAPTIAPHGDETVEATSALGATVNYIAPATFDAVDGAGTASCSPASGSLFPFGTTTVNCSAMDSHGNNANGSFTVTVVDTTPPALTLPSNLTVTALNASGAVVNFVTSANDLVDGSIAVICSPVSGSLFPIGMSSVSCSATDAHGNNASGIFTVSVQYVTEGNKCRGIPGHQILQPINTDGSSVFKAGSTVPAKFRVCGSDGVSIGTDGVVSNFRLVQIISNGIASNVDEAVLSATPDDAFRSGNQQWIFDINTKNLFAGNTYIYLITLNDGSTIQFQFALK
jgi:HYR domain-containing protein